MRPLASRLIAAPALFAVLVLMLVACGGGAAKTDIAGVKANDHGTKDVSGMTVLSLEMDNYYFNPSVLKGTPGQKLTLQLKNETSNDHNFTQQAQGINKDVTAGKTTETVQVTFPASGVISFFCEYHKNKGMAGGLQAS